AADAAGNSVAGEFDVTVEDTTPPSIPEHRDQFAEQDFSGGARVTYDPEVTAQDAVDPTPTTMCDPESGTEFLLEPEPSSTVSCTAIDDSGNRSALMQFTVTVLRGPVPDAPIIAVKPPAVTNATSAHFEFSTMEGISSVRCRLYDPNHPDGPFADCLGSQDYTGLTEGPHLFQIRVMNGIGTVSEASYSWTVDLTKPGTVTDFRVRARPGSVTLRWVPPIDADVDRVRIQRQRVGTAIWKTIAERDAATYTDRAVANDVRYRYGIVSIDPAGNVSDPAFATGRPSRLSTPEYNATTRPPVLVDWTSVRKATYYNLQVWRNGRKILSIWPSRSRYRVPSSWEFKGKRYSISRQRHVLYVWPGFGSKAAVKYGRLVGSTSFFGA
ncbi:MAG: HYR domain-containing protein, partial [Gaiellales bacterium]